MCVHRDAWTAHKNETITIYITNFILLKPNENEEEITLNNTFATSFYNEWSNFKNINNNLKIGFNIKFKLKNGENISYNIYNIKNI